MESAAVRAVTSMDTLSRRRNSCPELAGRFVPHSGGREQASLAFAQRGLSDGLRFCAMGVLSITGCTSASAQVPDFPIINGPGRGTSHGRSPCSGVSPRLRLRETRATADRPPPGQVHGYTSEGTTTPASQRGSDPALSRRGGRARGRPSPRRSRRRGRARRARRGPASSPRPRRRRPGRARGTAATR